MNRYWLIVFLYCLAAALSVPAQAQEIPYGTGNWDRQKFGNHRAVIEVAADTNVVWTHIPWRRIDDDPAGKAIVMVDASSGKVIDNVYAMTVTQEYADIAFEPATGKGIYYLYYLPYTMTGTWYFPGTSYLKPVDRCDPVWLKQLNGYGNKELRAVLRKAVVKRFEAIDDFDSFYPMEVCATEAEVHSLIEKNRDKQFLVFPEDRKYPIRMSDHLPYKWIREGPGDHFKGIAFRNEFYAFQLGIYAAFCDVKDLSLSYSDLETDDGRRIPGSQIRCFNLGGIDWEGKPFTKAVNVVKGSVQALWAGVDIPSPASPGLYHGIVTVKADGLRAQQVSIALQVEDTIIPDRGYDDLFRHARLNWLNSRIASDDDVFRPYTAVTLNDHTIGILGRTLTFGRSGFPAKITSSFTAGNDGIDGPEKNILAAPVKFTTVMDGRVLAWNTERLKIKQRFPGAVSWGASSSNENISMDVEAKMECDGYINYRVTLTARKRTTLEDIRLQIPYNKEHATYMMGMGFKGGRRPEKWDWKWEHPNGMVWLGGVNSGLQCKLKNEFPSWDLYDFGKTGLYKNWSNEGKGGCRLEEKGDVFLMTAYTGSIVIKAGEKLHFNFGLLITPVKMLDKAHWDERYFQADPPVDTWLGTAERKGANIINIHQGNVLNPYINYPWAETDTLKRFIARAADAGVRTKIYYTVRELSNHAAEIWALRSLGDEIFTRGRGTKLADQFARDRTVKNSPDTGGSWLAEHLRSDYDPAWHTPLDGGAWDMAIRTQGLSRWHNYYLEGLNWLVRHDGIRGIYLDGIGYDRDIMKRVRKVLDRAADSCLVDFHSGNSLFPQYGLNSPANQCMELFPFINSLWLGEAYDYNETPEYWLVEVSGIPFGLYGEMLNGCGNAYRGMVYGMTSRLGWTGCDPSPLWKIWDRFGIREASMMGYWDPRSPVRSRDRDIKVTVYGRGDSVMIAYASWADHELPLALDVDWEKLGMNPQNVRIAAPAIENFQAGKETVVLKDLQVPAGGGGIIIFKKQP